MSQHYPNATLYYREERSYSSDLSSEVDSISVSRTTSMLFHYNNKTIERSEEDNSPITMYVQEDTNIFACGFLPSAFFSLNIHYYIFLFMSNI